MNENERDEKEIIENTKLINPLKTILTEDTIVEDPQYLIDGDEPERKKAFKEAEAIISALDPEPTKKRKNRKEKEKQKFEKDLAIIRQNEQLRQKQQEQNKQRTQEHEDKGMERGE